MQTLVYINPLKPGKLDEYKAFIREFTGPRKKEYVDLLDRYGLISAEVYYHKLENKEFIIVIHDAEDDASERLANFSSSENPFDHWFFTQLSNLHDFTQSETRAKHLLTFHK